MKFVFISTAALSPLLVLVILSLQISSQEIASWFAVFSWGGLGILTLAAVRLRQSGAPGFDMLVASETIVVFGILSLIFGIVLSVVVAFASDIPIPPRTLSDLKPVVFPFGEGLISSGVAPFLGNLLRQYEVLRYGSETRLGSREPIGATVDDLEAMRVAIHRLKEEADRFSVFLQTKTTAIEKIFAAKLGDIEGGLGALYKSVDALEKKILTSAEHVTAISETFATTVSKLDRSTELVAKTIDSMNSEVGHLTTGARTCAENVEAMNLLIAKMNTLIENVGRIMENIDNFFSPSRRIDER